MVSEMENHLASRPGSRAAWVRPGAISARLSICQRGAAIRRRARIAPNYVGRSLGGA